MFHRCLFVINLKWFLFLFFLLLSQITFALPFNITTKAGTALPTIVPAGGAATAYYTVQNNTASTRINNYVKYLPPHVFQVASGGTFPNTCASLFTLEPRGEPGDSCTLQLTVTGSVHAGDPDPHHHLFVCFPGGTTCAGPLNPLNVSVLQSITIVPTNPSVNPGQRLQFTAIGHFADGSTQNLTSLVTWTSSNTSVATINSGGLATATTSQTGGVTTITATFGTVSASTTLTVSSLVSISLIPANPIVSRGASLQFTAIGNFSDGSSRNVTPLVTSWTSSNTSVATINSSGLATASSNFINGTTTITATIGSISGSTILTVPSLTTITVTPANPTVAPGNTLQFTATGTFSDGSTLNITSSVTWNSSNTSAATINSSGLATATLTGGITTISATFGPISGSTQLTVPSLLSITVTPANPTIVLGGTLQFTATGNYSDSSTRNLTNLVTWSSSNTSANVINSNGLAVCTGLGSSTISAQFFSIIGSTTLTNSRLLLVAAGQDFTGTMPPLVLQSLDGVNWANPLPSGIPSAGTLNAAACTGNGALAFCIGVGTNQSTNAPLLEQTINGGISWSAFTIAPTTNNGGFAAAACTGNTYCIAAGSNLNLSPSGPLLAQGTNTGAPGSWNDITSTVTGLTNSSTFRGAACTGSGSSAVCTVIGQDNLSAAPVLAQTTNGGSSWAVVTSIPGLPSTGLLLTTACTGTGSTSICIAGGEPETLPNPPLFIQTTNGGTSWSTVPVSGMTTNGVITGSACTGSGSTAICIAGGIDQNTLLPFLIQSTNGGTNWNVVSIPSLTNIGQITFASCTGTGSSAVCIAGGSYLGGGSFLIQSLNGGQNWSLVTSYTPALPASTGFEAASCTGGGAKTQCFIVGFQGSSSFVPLIVSSVNGGTSPWNVITPSSPTNGELNGAGSAGGATNFTAKKKFGAQHALEKIFKKKFGSVVNRL